MNAASHHVIQIHRHLVNLSAVVLLNVPQDADVFIPHEVDCDTIATVSATTPDAVDVQLTVVGKVIVDD
jgi:hypothetical protein